MTSVVLVETPSRRSSSCVRYPAAANMPNDGGRFSPSLKAFKSACQRSLSLRTSEAKRPVILGKPITGPLLTKKALTFWSETVQSPVRKMCTSSEVKRQEAIFELIQSEKELVGDLLSLNLFYERLKSANLLSANELAVVFNCYAELSICHQDLVSILIRHRDDNGRFGPIGQAILKWVDDLEKYKIYCPGLINAKNLIDIRYQTSQQFANVLNECRTVVRSRLDLYSILDKPRSRLVKYPIMLRNVMKHTDIAHVDQMPLLEATKKVENLLYTVNKLTGDAQLALVKRQLASCDGDPVLDSASRLIFDGPLRTHKGTKVQAFLFDSGLILARPTTSSSSHHPEYRLYVPGLPADILVIEDIQLPPQYMHKLGASRSSSGSSLLRDIFGSANRSNLSGSNNDLTSISSSSNHKSQSMFRVFTRVPENTTTTGSSSSLKSQKDSNGTKKKHWLTADHHHHNHHNDADNPHSSSERIALVALDDHAKRAWLDKLHSIAETYLTTF